MKMLLIAFVVFFVCFWGYAYTHDQPGCQKILRDFAELGQTLAAGKTAPATPPPAPPEQPAIIPVVSKPPAAPPPVPTPPVQPAPPAQPEALWVAPMSIPTQTHWNLTTSTGHIYPDAQITLVEADCITVQYAGGNALVPISTLSPELQKELNYNPDAAAAATAKRKAQGQVVPQ